MNKILFGLLQSLVRTIIGALNYERIALLVQDANQSSLSGDEKRDLVIEEARNIGQAIGMSLLNLAIETAVNALKSKS